MDRVAGKARVARVRRAGVGTFGVLVPHLAPDLRPDTVTTYKNVRLHGFERGAALVGLLALAHEHPDAAAGEVLVSLHGSVANDSVVAADFIQKQLLQIRPVNDTCVREAEEFGRLGDRFELRVPLRPDPILDAIRACARKCELLHHLVKEVLVDSLDCRQRVAGQLDGPAKAGKLASLLEHSHLHALLLQRLGEKKPTHTPARDNHLERIFRRHRLLRLHRQARQAPGQARCAVRRSNGGRSRRLNGEAMIGTQPERPHGAERESRRKSRGTVCQQQCGEHSGSLQSPHRSAESGTPSQGEEGEAKVVTCSLKHPQKKIKSNLVCVEDHAGTARVRVRRSACQRGGRARDCCCVARV